MAKWFIVPIRNRRDVKKMKVMKVRTKIELIISLGVIILVSIIGVASVTRIITDSNDNVATFIRNSNGNIWEVNEINLQAAIDDLNGDGGYVKVGDDITLTSPIQLDGDHYCELDFENHKVTLSNDISFIIVESTSFATVKNVRVILTSDHTASVLHLRLPSGSGWSDKIRYNNFENIVIQNTGYWIPGVGYGEHNYTGIHLEIKADSNFLCNTFRNIQMFGAGTGIYLECDHETGWGNGNYFEDIWIDQFDTAIWFSLTADSNNGFNQNVFQHIKAQSATFSRYGVRDISRNANHFDHVLMWDWWVTENPVHEWSLTNRAYRTYICAHLIDEINDNGLYTTMAKP